jgi:hypothetical protein
MLSTVRRSFSWVCLLLLLWDTILISTISSSPGLLTPQKHPLHRHPAIAIITFIYDEKDILEYWLQFHSQIIGLKNIAVIDNMSPNGTISILQKWEKKGLHVIYNFPDYMQKGTKIAETFHQIFPNHDIAIPLDIDEFLVSLNNKGIPEISIRNIHRTMQELFLTKYNCFQVRYVYNNCNKFVNETIETIQHFAHNVSSAYLQKHRKRFFRLKTLKTLDHGNHFGTFTGGAPSCTTNVSLAYLHYHNRDLLLKIQHAVKDVIEFGHLPKNTTVQNLDKDLVVKKLFPNKKVMGYHKIVELKNYVDNGIEGLMIGCPPRPVVLPTIREILQLQQDQLQQFFLEYHSSFNRPSEPMKAATTAAGTTGKGIPSAQQKKGNGYQRRSAE